MKGINNYVELEKLIPELPDPGEKEKYEMLKPTKFEETEIPDEGVVLNLHTKKVKLKPYKKIKRKGDTYLFSKKRSNNFEMLSKVS